MSKKLFAVYGIFLSGGLFIAIMCLIHSTDCCSTKQEDPRSITSPDPPIKLCRGDRVYFNDTRKCYELSSKGPCEELMVLEPVPGTEFGRCDCKGLSECFDRPIIYWPDKNRCYFIYEQGPCSEGQWLVPRKDAGPKCDTIPCPEEYNAQPMPFHGESPYLFSYENKCYMTGVIGKGPCDQNKVAYINGYKHGCSWPISCSLSGITNKINDCGDGTWPDLNGGCEPMTVL